VSGKPVALAIAAYYLTLGAMGAASLFPGRFVWGLENFAYCDPALRYILLGFGLVWPIVAVRFGRMGETDATPDPRWRLRAGLVIAALAIFFILGRARTFYLGDGYTVLASLASDHPILKLRAFGEVWIHLLVRNLFGVGESAALGSFQVISIAAGVTWTGIVAWTAGRLFAATRERILWLMALATPGVMLLFFGYVEYYSMFVVAIGWFGLCGLLIIEKHLTRWWILPPMLLALFFHVMGVVLLPAAIYVIVAPTKFGRRFDSASLSKRLTMLGLAAIPIAAALFYVSANNLSFRLALLPVVANRFTVDGYMLFSPAHLADLANLIMLLVPSLLVLLFGLAVTKTRHPLPRPAISFALLYCGCVLAAAAVFDPKIGLPRDWDLFAFVGMALAITVVYAVMRSLRAAAVPVLLLATGLQVLALAPRVAVLVDHDKALSQFRAYVSYDPLKSRNAMSLIVTHYQDRGDAAQAQAEYATWAEIYPEFQKNRTGLQYLKEGRFAEALALFRETIAINPAFIAGYSNVGAAYSQQKNNDSARVYLEIARAMNPYNPVVMTDYGQVLWRLGRHDDAAKLFLRALTIDSTLDQATFGLMGYYSELGDRENYFAYLARTVVLKDAPSGTLRELGEYYLQTGEWGKAREIFTEAIGKGLDTAYVRTLRERFPQLTL